MAEYSAKAVPEDKQLAYRSGNRRSGDDRVIEPRMGVRQRSANCALAHKRSEEEGAR